MNVLQTEYASCPLCNAHDKMLIGIADCTKHPGWHDRLPTTLEWLRCKHCAHVFTRYFWSDIGLQEVFRYAHPNQLAGRSSNPDAKRVLWCSVVDKTVELLGGYGQVFGYTRMPIWIDVGCGDGALTMTAADFGFSAIGVDARAETVERIKNLGFLAQQGDFMKLNFDSQVDVLSMMDVLEHMPYPRQALEKAVELLKTGGIIVISLPDLNCSSWRIMDKAKVNPYWAEIEHHHNFSRQRLMALLNQFGFEIVNFTIPNRYKAQIEIYAKKVL